MNVYETMINSIANDIAGKAEAILMERMRAVINGPGMIASLLVETEPFKRGVEVAFEKFIDENHEFKAAVEGIAEEVADSSIQSAISRHEDESPHITADEIFNERDFERSVETVINESELNESVSGIKDEITDIQKWIKETTQDGNDDGMLVARLLAILVRSEFRKPILRVLATGAAGIDHAQQAADAEAGSGGGAGGSATFGDVGSGGQGETFDGPSDPRATSTSTPLEDETKQEGFTP